MKNCQKFVSDPIIRIIPPGAKFYPPGKRAENCMKSGQKLTSDPLMRIHGIPRISFIFDHFKDCLWQFWRGNRTENLKSGHNLFSDQIMGIIHCSCPESPRNSHKFHQNFFYF